jgi:hypothetical protein
MKKIFIKLGIYAVLAYLVALLIWLLVSTVKENKRLKNNFYTELQQNFERQQTITKKEFKKYFDEYVSELKEYGIKPNQVENVINVSYRYKDTLIPKTVLNFKDSLIEYYDTSFIVTFSEFDIESHCNRIKGYILADTLAIQSVETTDKLLISLYKEKRRCIFGKRGIKAIAISDCKKDTLTILRNLKVGK